MRYLNCFPRFLQIMGSDSSLLYLSWSHSCVTAHYEIGLRRTLKCSQKSDVTRGEKCAAERLEAFREPCCHSVRQSWGKDEWEGSCSWDVSNSSIGQQSLQVASWKKECGFRFTQTFPNCSKLGFFPPLDFSLEREY